MIPMQWLLNFEQVIASVILFTALFANEIMICSTSAARVPLVLSCFNKNSAWAAAEFEQVIVLVIYFPPC